MCLMEMMEMLSVEMRVLSRHVSSIIPFRCLFLLELLGRWSSLWPWDHHGINISSRLLKARSVVYFLSFSPLPNNPLGGNSNFFIICIAVHYNKEERFILFKNFVCPAWPLLLGRLALLRMHESDLFAKRMQKCALVILRKKWSFQGKSDERENLNCPFCLEVTFMDAFCELFMGLRRVTVHISQVFHQVFSCYLLVVRRRFFFE